MPPALETASCSNPGLDGPPIPRHPFTVFCQLFLEVLEPW